MRMVSLETGWPIVLGLLLLITIMFRPTGLIGLLVSDRERIGTYGRATPRAAKLSVATPAVASTFASCSEARSARVDETVDIPAPAEERT